MNCVLRDSTELKELRRQVSEQKFESLKEKFKEIPINPSKSNFQSTLYILAKHIKRIFA